MYLSASTRESTVLAENLLVRESNKKQQQKKNNHIDNSKSYCLLKSIGGSL